jgi:hypothetical protein
MDMHRTAIATLAAQRVATTEPTVIINPESDPMFLLLRSTQEQMNTINQSAAERLSQQTQEILNGLRGFNSESNVSGSTSRSNNSGTNGEQNANAQTPTS